MFLKKLAYKFIITLFLCIFFLCSKAQKKDKYNFLYMVGYLREEKKFPVEGVEIILINEENNKVEKKILSGKRGKFKLEIPLGEIYILKFNKKGYAQKKILIDAYDIKEENNRWGFDIPNIFIDLYPYFESVDYSILKKPISEIIFDYEKDEFKFDEKVEKSFSEGIEMLEENLAFAIREKEMLQFYDEQDVQLAIKDAQSFEEEGDFENAFYQYQAVLKINPKQEGIKEKISKVKKKIKTITIDDDLLTEEDKKAKLELQFKNYIIKADSIFKTKEYMLAKSVYQKAKKLKSNDDYVLNQIKKIISILENKRKEEKLEQKFNTLLDKADDFFKTKEYKKTLYNYKEAKNIKSTKDLLAKIKLVEELIEKEKILANKIIKKEIIKKSNKIITIITVTNKITKQADIYKKEVYNFGQIFYLKNSKSYNKVNWEKETNYKNDN